MLQDTVTLISKCASRCAFSDSGKQFEAVAVSKLPQPTFRGYWVGVSKVSTFKGYIGSYRAYIGVGV